MTLRSQIYSLVVVLIIVLASLSAAFSQVQPVAAVRLNNALRTDLTTESPLSNDASYILANFVAAETRVRDALNQHMFKRDVVLQTIGPNGEVTGEYIRNSQFVFDDRGKRIERITYHPRSTIREMRITKEDIQDLADAQLLGIDIVEAAKYTLAFVGTETIDSRVLFAVDITPQVQPDPKNMRNRFFVGRVWLDPRSFQIVKIKGVVEPQGKQRFPVFETWREPQNNNLDFPCRTEADDVLHFRENDVHYRIKVRYYDYKLFASKVTITDVDEPVIEGSKTQGKFLNTSPVNQSNSNSVNSVSQNVGPPPHVPVELRQPAISCTTNKSAPPIGPYHWPADTEVKVYFIRTRFTPDQKDALVEALATWTAAESENGSGVRFVEAGETDARMACRSCLTVDRREVHKRDKGFYAFFHPMNEEENRLLISAWIDLDFGITKPAALKGFMVHELAHGLGLWDCTTCRSKQTIMNGFTSMSKDNGLSTPSKCDLATVRNVYQEERALVAARLPKNNGSVSIAAASSQTERSLFTNTNPFEPSVPAKNRYTPAGASATSLMGLNGGSSSRSVNRYAPQSWFAQQRITGNPSLIY